MTAFVRIGDLREKVVIQSATTAIGSFGNIINTLSTFATVSASVIEKATSEAFKAERLSSQATYFITIRYLAGLTPNMQVQWRGRQLTVKAIKRLDQMRRFIQIECDDINPDAGATPIITSATMGSPLGLLLSLTKAA